MNCCFLILILLFCCNGSNNGCFGNCNNDGRSGCGCNDNRSDRTNWDRDRDRDRSCPCQDARPFSTFSEPRTCGCEES